MRCSSGREGHRHGADQLEGSSEQELIAGFLDHIRHNPGSLPAHPVGLRAPTRTALAMCGAQKLGDEAATNPARWNAAQCRMCGNRRPSRTCARSAGEGPVLPASSVGATRRSHLVRAAGARMVGVERGVSLTSGGLTRILR